MEGKQSGPEDGSRFIVRMKGRKRDVGLGVWVRDMYVVDDVRNVED